MDRNKIVENINKNKVKLEKVEALLAKRLEKVETYKEKLVKNGITSKDDCKVFDDNFEMFSFIENWEKVDGHNERYFFENKMKDIKKAIETWKARLVKEDIKLQKMSKLPEVLKVLLEDLKKDYFEDAKRKRDFLAKQLKELGYSEFVKKYSYHAYYDAFEEDEKLQKESYFRAECEVTDLFERIKKITGENITDYKDIHYAGKCLDGFVTGETGIAEVHTIYAGGYNIQCLHLRTLVHKK